MIRQNLFAATLGLGVAFWAPLAAAIPVSVSIERIQLVDPDRTSSNVTEFFLVSEVAFDFLNVYPSLGAFPQVHVCIGGDPPPPGIACYNHIQPPPMVGSPGLSAWTFSDDVDPSVGVLDVRIEVREDDAIVGIDMSPGNPAPIDFGLHLLVNLADGTWVLADDDDPMNVSPTVAQSELIGPGDLAPNDSGRITGRVFFNVQVGDSTDCIPGTSFDCTVTLDTPGCQDGVAGAAVCDSSGVQGPCVPDNSGAMELPNGLDDNCDGVGLNDEFCDGVDNDMDGLIDEDAGSCTERFLFVPMCWVGDQTAAIAAANRSVRFMEEKSLLTDCASPWIPSMQPAATGQKFWVDVLDVGTMPCLTDPTAAEIVATLENAGVELKNYDVVTLYTDIPSPSCVAGFVAGEGMISYEAGTYAGEYIVWAHEYGHLMGLGEEYRVDNSGPNTVTAAEGCDPTTCCTLPHSCTSLNGQRCSGNLARDVSGWSWGVEGGSITLLDPAGNPGVPPIYGNSRCIMSNASADGWETATDGDGTGSERSWCKRCLDHWTGNGTTCLETFAGVERRLEALGTLGPNAKVVLDAHNVADGRVGMQPAPANGNVMIAVTDANGFFLGSFSPEPTAAEPFDAYIDYGFWLRVPVDPSIDDADPITFTGLVDGIPVSQTTANGEPPVAVALGTTIECSGPDGAFVMLDASASSDPDGDTLVFEWEAPVGVPLEGADTATPFGQFPLGVTELTLVVGDGSGLYDFVVVEVIVEDTTPPEFETETFEPITASTCSLSGDDVSVAFPIAADLCGDATVTGVVTSSDSADVPFAVPADGSFPLPPGTHTITWSATDGVNPPVEQEQVVTLWPGVFANELLDIRDRAKVRNTSNAPAALANAGTALTQVGGAGTLTGPILSAAAVKIWGGTVAGDIISAAAIEHYNNSSIGDTFPFTTVVLPSFASLPVSSSSAGGASWNVNGQEIVTLAPGSYGTVNVNSGGKLVLGAGDYSFVSLSTNDASSVIEVPAGGDTPRVFVEQTLNYRGPFLKSDGTAAQIYLEYAGAQAVLEASFAGILLAKNGLIEMGRNGTTNYYGQFIARSLIVRSDTEVTCATLDELDVSFGAD